MEELRHIGGGGAAGQAAAAAAVAARRAASVHSVGLAIALSDEGNGSYSGAFAVTRSGGYLLHVQRDGVPIKGSPVHVAVRPGLTYGPRCQLRAEGEGLPLF